MQPGLAKRLRVETRELHRRAERTGVMLALLRGELDRSAYCALLRNLHDIYSALESALTQHARHPRVAPIHLPALFRQAALSRDLDALHGGRWRHDVHVQPATRRYVSRLHHVADEAPELLAAHAYVRYLGDLSGGQLLRPTVARMLALGGADGARFYDFGPALEVATHAQRLRAGLDSIATDDAPTTAAIVAEAKLAFELHVQLFAELLGDRRTTDGRDDRATPQVTAPAHRRGTRPPQPG